MNTDIVVDATKSTFKPNLEFSRAVREINAESELSLPLNIYEDLPVMPHMKTGLNDEKLYEMIAKAYPEGILYPNCRENRRKLYMSIYFLRTDSKRKWAADVKVKKGEYVEDKLFKNTRVLLH